MKHISTTLQFVTAMTVLIVLCFFMVNTVIAAAALTHTHSTAVHQMDNCFGSECAPAHHVLQSVPLPYFTLHTNTMFQKHISNEYIQYIGPTIEPASPPPRLLI